MLKHGTTFTNVTGTLTPARRRARDRAIVHQLRILGVSLEEVCVAYGTTPVGIERVLKRHQETPHV